MLRGICEVHQLTASMEDRLIDKIYIFHDKKEIKCAMQNVYPHTGYCVNET